MAAVCRHFKFGHCKFGQLCRNQHVATVCSKIQCDIDTCPHRHPQPCRYFINFGRCKFSPCSYSHGFSWTQQKLKLDNLESAVTGQDGKIEEMLKMCANLNETVKQLQSKYLEIEER